jgi:hypothetical protein
MSEEFSFYKPVFGSLPKINYNNSLGNVQRDIPVPKIGTIRSDYNYSLPANPALLRKSGKNPALNGSSYYRVGNGNYYSFIYKDRFWIQDYRYGGSDSKYVDIALDRSGSNTDSYIYAQDTNSYNFKLEANSSNFSDNPQGSRLTLNAGTDNSTLHSGYLVLTTSSNYSTLYSGKLTLNEHEGTNIQIDSSSGYSQIAGQDSSSYKFTLQANAGYEGTFLKIEDAYGSADILSNQITLTDAGGSPEAVYFPNQIQMSGSGYSHTFTIQQLSLCIDGVSKTMYVLGTDPV